MLALFAVVLTVFLAGVLWALVLALHLPIALGVVFTAIMALTWVGVVAWRLVAARQAAGAIEKGLAAQAEAQARMAAPDQRAGIEEMRAEFASAVQALKASRLARGGRDALAVLPWYMIIGPPGAGKSTALRASGLRFPYATKRGGVRGVGGTKNCEWWLTNEAVILDTAGRYATQEEDHEEWMRFLQTVARARRRRPFNGLIVAMPLTDVAATTEEEAAELGHKLRERVDEVMASLGVVLPVYVLLTKCDLLPGFVESFADLRKGDRNQVWGFTIPLSGRHDRAAGSGERFDELLTVIEARALQRLASERQLDARERIYEFPQHLSAARPQLGAFLEALVAESVYQETPILRGVYLTSGTQEGRVVDRIMASMAEAFGVRPALAKVVPAVDAKSYFLRDVFDKVLFPDQHIAFRGAAAVRRQRLRDAAALGVAAALLLLFIAFPVRAFLASRALVHATGAEVEAAASRLVTAPGRSPPLAELEPLRQRLELLVRQQRDGAPWAFGMYRGDVLLRHLRSFYGGTVRRLVIDPAFRQEVEALEAFARSREATDQPPPREEHARFYDRLKYYLLLTAPRELTEPPLGSAEAEWIGGRTAAVWDAGGAAAAGEVPGVEKHAELFAELLAGDPSLALPRSQSLVHRTRRVLARLPLSTLVEERLAVEADAKGLELTLPALVGRSVTALRAAQGIRGAYTRRGYDEVVKDRLQHPEALFELWVLAIEGAAGEDRIAAERERIRSRYFERYADEWRRFLDGLTVDAAASPEGLLDELTSGEVALYPRLFQAVAYHTRLGGTAAPAGKALERVGGGAAGAVVSRAKGVARSEAADRGGARTGPADVEKAFDVFVRFGVPQEGQAGAPGTPAPRTPLDAYQEILVTLRDARVTSLAGGDEERKQYLAAATRAQTSVQGLLRHVEGRWLPRLQALLVAPVQRALREARSAPIRNDATAWCELVAQRFRRSLSGRYPFVREGPDAALPDVVEFFRPETGVLWGFYTRSLQGTVQRASDGFRFNGQGGEVTFRPELLAYLQRSQEITGALFPPGAQEASVPLNVRIRATAPIASVVLVVDGQRQEYVNGPERWGSLNWPNKAAGGNRGVSLRARTAEGSEWHLEREGEWGLLHWLEQGKVVGAPTERDFTLEFETELGASVRIDFHQELGASPFFRPGSPRAQQLLEPFRTFPAAPPAIGPEGGACE